MLGQNILVMCETYKYNKEPTGKKRKDFILLILVFDK